MSRDKGALDPRRMSQGEALPVPGVVAGRAPVEHDPDDNQGCRLDAELGGRQRLVYSPDSDRTLTPPP